MGVFGCHDQIQCVYLGRGKSSPAKVQGACSFLSVTGMEGAIRNRSIPDPTSGPGKAGSASHYAKLSSHRCVSCDLIALKPRVTEFVTFVQTLRHYAKLTIPFNDTCHLAKA